MSNMTPDNTARGGSASQEELKDTTAIIADYAARKGVGITRLVKDYPALGSEKTFRDLKAGKVEGYDLAKHLDNYRAVASVIEQIAGDGEETLYDNLPGAKEVRAAVIKVMGTWGTDRVVFIDGESGIGKTTAAKLLIGRYGSRVRMIEADELWKDSPGTMLAEILTQFGEVTPPYSGIARLRRVKELLGVSRVCIIIDEAHHLGPSCLNIIKTLVNQTPGEFVLIGIPEMWVKLYKAAFSEARQLSTNRINSRVKLSIDTDGVEAYLANIFPDADKKDIKNAAQMIRPAAQNNGALAFVRDVSKELINTGFSIENAAKAVSVVLARRSAKKEVRHG